MADMLVPRNYPVERYEHTQPISVPSGASTASLLIRWPTRKDHLIRNHTLLSAKRCDTLTVIDLLLSKQTTHTLSDWRANRQSSQSFDKNSESKRKGRA